MKKPIFVCILILILAMTACQIAKPEDPSQTNGSDIEASEIANTTPDRMISYSFTSYQELKIVMTNSKHATNQAMATEAAQYGALYCATLSAFSTQRISIMVPTINNVPIPLRSKEGFDNITLFTNDLYDLPWIWYHCTVGEADLKVSVAYPALLNNAAVDQCKTYSEIRDLIAPDAPSPDNYTEFDSYRKIYEKELTLGNGEKALAVISELKESDREYVMLCQDGILVYLYADKSLFTDSFWSAFSMSEYK